MNHDIQILEEKDLLSYKNIIDSAFGKSNDIEKYKSYSQNKGYTIFVVKRDDQIVGTITQCALDLFTFDDQPCLILCNFTVKKEYRKEKIGLALLEYVIDKAKTDGYKSISITCFSDALPAHKLYESLGFDRTDHIKFNLSL